MKYLLKLIILSALCLACKNSTHGKPLTKTIKNTTYPTIGYLEKIDDAFYDHVSKSTKIEVIADGFIWTEGPVWIADEQCLLFSDVPQNINYKWTENEGANEFLNPSGYTGKDKKLQGSNGMYLDPDNNLILCQTGDRVIARYIGDFKNPSPVFEVVASQFEDKKFNAPNDLVIDKKGNIYFTDPDFGLEDGVKEIEYQGVYMIDTMGEVKLLTSKWPAPNGIGLSPDASKLYLANSIPAMFISYDISKEGQLINEKIVLDLQEVLEQSISKQKPDGMAIKKDGTIFLTGPDGVFVIDKNGKHLGTIKTDKLTSNCTFNEDESVLYVSCHELILRIKLN
ncbi:SMP-30/gluconolactonase/LRE family protein [Maribacter aquivivus]|uniref:SMP-30/gluconolactonase/LRE family protein n=1 Tax=Maribacter aquivivus TaxID=228958 RepID=UPI002490118C|nr:SMP-30/gluconolactonase/LRE family protein [Maribacter aquivivus]